MTIADLARRASKIAIDHSPTILTSIGVAGAVTTAYLAGKASIEAADLIRLKEAGEPEWDEVNQKRIYLEPKERAKQRFLLVWKLYIPAATTLAATITCIIGANRVGSRRAAGLAAAMTIGEKTFEEYKAKVIEKMGVKKEEAVRDEIAQDRVDKTYLDDVQVFGPDVGELCYDKWSDRYFRSSVEGIRSAENDLNYALIHDGYASLSEFYGFLGLPSPVYSESVGWNSDRKLELGISSTLAHGIKPCLVVDFKTEPRPDYGRFR